MREITLRGIPLTVHNEDDMLSNAIIRNGDFWEADILDYIRDNYPRQLGIIDIGANIGNHSIYFANFLSYYETIIAFEPEPKNYDLLSKNMAPYTRVGITNSALSNHSGNLRMSRSRDNSGAHEVNEHGDLEVTCFTLDKFMFTRVSFIKIDAEWHEPQILEGASDTLIRCRPLVLIEDIHNIYGDQFPKGYKLIQRWDHHQTSLYESE